MAVPDFQSIMLPLLEYASDGETHSLRNAREALADRFSLSEEERREMLPSGKQTSFDNRVSWARTYLKQAGLIEDPKRAHFQITERGLSILKNNPHKIDIPFLEQFDDFVEFRQRKPKPDLSQETEAENHEGGTPEEELEAAFQNLKQNLISEILKTLKGSSPDFFEKLVVDLLVKMGYGGSRKEAGEAVGKSGDGGIDGIIKEDRLGLDIIYLQAKRWQNTVGRPDIQKFAGALQGFRARKGIFLTTSGYSREALDYVSNIDSKIILIDGQQLAEFMIEHNVGVSPEASFEIKRLDTDYFEEA